jgi:hypothetical protein
MKKILANNTFQTPYSKIEASVAISITYEQRLSPWGSCTLIDALTKHAAVGAIEPDRQLDTEKMIFKDHCARFRERRDTEAPFASLALSAPLSRLRRYRSGNCTFVTFQGEGNHSRPCVLRPAAGASHEEMRDSQESWERGYSVFHNSVCIRARLQPCRKTLALRWALASVRSG